MDEDGDEGFLEESNDVFWIYNDNEIWETFACVGRHTMRAESEEGKRAQEAYAARRSKGKGRKKGRGKSSKGSQARGKKFFKRRQGRGKGKGYWGLDEVDAGFEAFKGAGHGK